MLQLVAFLALLGLLLLFWLLVFLLVVLIVGVIDAFSRIVELREADRQEEKRCTRRFNLQSRQCWSQYRVNGIGIGSRV